MATLGIFLNVQREVNGTDGGCLSLGTLGGGMPFIILEGCVVPDPSVSSLYVVSDFPSKLFSNLFTTSLPLPLLFLLLHSVVWHSLHVVPVLCGEFSVHSCDSCRLSCLEVNSGSGENCRNFLCNMGATQPITIFVPPPFCESTQLCGIDILPPSCNSTLLCAFRYLQLFLLRSMHWISSLPPLYPFHLSFPSSFGRLVWRERMC